MFELLKNPKLGYISKQMEGLSEEDRRRHMQRYVGVVPLYQLMAVDKFLQLEKEKLEQIQPPSSMPQTTVAEDLDSELAQLEASRGMGIAALPNPAMDNATFSAAGGGIVAFGRGGSTDETIPKFSVGGLGRLAKFAKRHPWWTSGGAGLGLYLLQREGEEPTATAEEIPPAEFSEDAQRLLRDRENNAIESMSGRFVNNMGLPSLESPEGLYDDIIDRQKAQIEKMGDPSLQSGIDEVQAIYNQYGIGEALKAEQERIKAAQEEMGENLNKQKWMDWLSYWGEVGQQANKPGANLLSSLAGGVSKFAESRAKTMKDYEAEKNRLADRLFASATAGEQLSKDVINKGQETYRNAIDRLDTLNEALNSSETARADAIAAARRVRFTMATQAAITTASQKYNEMNPITIMQRAYIDALAEGKTAVAKEIESKLNDLVGATYGAQAKADAKNSGNFRVPGNVSYTELLPTD